MKTFALSLTAVLLVCLSTNAQELGTHGITDILEAQGELTFTFKIDDTHELSELSNTLTIVSFDADTHRIKAWTNREQFQNFLSLNKPIKVYSNDNDSNERLMTNRISAYSKTLKPGYTLEFPLAAYPTYADYEAQMQNFETEHSDIVDFFSIGHTEQGDKELLFVKISDQVATDEAEPKLLYTSTMHGDELAGFPMMMNLIDYLITAYKDQTHPDHNRIVQLINTTEIWINPNANPDGSYHLSTDNTSVAHARRGNANNVDLNRNYPDHFSGAHPDGEAYQAETLAFMELAQEHHFVLAANFHGGIELVNYPSDNTHDRHPDDAWFVLTAGEYRDNAQRHGPVGYMDDKNNGITNGADWYIVNGSRQDYMDHEHQCKELTIELSSIKKPYASQLNQLWHSNKEALVDYLMQGTYGLRGVVEDANTGKAITGATINIAAHDRHGARTTTDTHGDYYRPIYAGTYNVIVEAPNYEPMVLSNISITNYQTKLLDTIKLTPVLATSIENTIALSPTASNSIRSDTDIDSFDTTLESSNTLRDSFKNRPQQK